MAPPGEGEGLTSCKVTLLLLAACGRLLSLIGCVSAAAAIKNFDVTLSNTRDLKAKTFFNAFTFLRCRGLDSSLHRRLLCEGVELILLRWFLVRWVREGASGSYLSSLRPLSSSVAQLRALKPQLCDI